MAVDFRLIVVSDRAACAPVTIPEFASVLAANGVRAFLLRERDLDPAAYDVLASEVQTALGPSSTSRLIVHSHPALAHQRELALHLSESDIPVIERLRQQHGDAVTIGASVHAVETALHAQAAGASYVMFGPVFDTPSKRRYGPPQGLVRLALVCEVVNIPVFAVGGVTPARAAECIAAGAHGVACISGVLPAARTAESLRMYADAFGGL